jgi:hypothetical protein
LGLQRQLYRYGEGSRLRRQGVIEGEDWTVRAGRLVVWVAGAAIVAIAGTPGPASGGVSPPKIEKAKIARAGYRSKLRRRRKKGPVIVATPSVVAVNETTTLEGSGFPPDETVELRECGRSGHGPGELLKHPCVSTMSVETDTSGGFTATFPVKSCLRGEKEPKHAITCEVGKYKWGVDGFLLVGAVRLSVTPEHGAAPTS